MEDNTNNKNKPKPDSEIPQNAFEELFVRNLSYSTTEQGLAEFFGKYGDVEVTRILTDRQTQKSKGIGFCKFYEKKAAAAAMADKDNLELDGRKIEIRYSNDNSPRQGNKSNNKSSSKFSVFVGNLSFKSNENSIRKFFAPCGNILDIRIAKNDEGKMKGFAHIDFDSEDAVKKAVQKNGKNLDGRDLRVDESNNKSSGNRGNDNRGRGRGRGRGGRGQPNPMDKAKKSGAMIAPTESKVMTFDDDDE